MLTREDLVTIHERSEDKSRLDLTRHGHINFGLTVICAFIFEPREQPITHLCLAHNHIEDLAAPHLAPLLQANSPLISLDLSHNRIGLAGFRSIGRCLEENVVLKELNLSSNRLENVERVYLTNLEVFPYFTNALRLNRSLVTLNLSNNRFTNLALYALRNAFKENTTLTSIDLSGNQHPIDAEITADIEEVISRNQRIAERKEIIKCGWRPERHRFFGSRTRETIRTCLGLYERHPAEADRPASSNWDDSQYLLQCLPKEVFYYYLEHVAAMMQRKTNPFEIRQPLSIPDTLPTLERMNSTAPTEIVSTQDTEEALLSQDLRMS